MLVWEYPVIEYSGLGGNLLNTSPAATSNNKQNKGSRGEGVGYMLLAVQVGIHYCTRMELL